MTLIEAIKSGKAFRRPQKHNFVIPSNSNKYLSIFSIDDILSDDWEVEEKKIELSKREIQEAIELVLGRLDDFQKRNFDKTCEILGFFE